MKNLRMPLYALVAVLCVALHPPLESLAQESAYELLLKSHVNWNHLNPKRGDLAPSAGTLWGDRGQSMATGFLLRPSDGFESPPHIHNVSYRAIVINGLLHNDDPAAPTMWMPTGSFWTQPKEQVHITSARGSDVLAYVEIDDGPYLVLPKEQAVDGRERPIKIVPSNQVWLDASAVKWISLPQRMTASAGPKVSFLWGEPHDGGMYGTFVMIPPKTKAVIRSQGPIFRAVVIKGKPLYRTPEDSRFKLLEAGSYYGSTGKAEHHVASARGMETVIYVRTDGEYEILAGH